MIEIGGYEYARYGNKIIRRKGTEPWEDSTSDVPPEFFEEEAIRRAMRSGLVQRKRPQTAGTPVGSGTSGGIVKPNPVVEEVAEALGLSPQGLREALNTHTPSATVRIPEKEFDAKMKALGLSPSEARARFRGDFQEPEVADPNPL